MVILVTLQLQVENHLFRTRMGSPEKPCSGTLGDRLKGRIPLVRLRLALPIDYPSSEDPLHKVSEESLFWSNPPHH
jgi:hypothetical protein